MKVLHLSTTDIRGGAARGAFWLHQSLRGMGVESSMLVERKYSDDDNVVEANGFMSRINGRMRAELDKLPLRFYRKTNESFWTVGWMRNRIEREVRNFAPDIVHLHWTGGGYIPVQELRLLDYPLVWTLRDMWAFTGGCHYSAGCERYVVGCGQCPQLRSTTDEDLSRKMWRRREAEWRDVDLWLVPISNWLADCVRQSPLFKDARVQVIPNGLDTSRFHPIDPRTARAIWGLDPAQRYILYGALGATRDPRKGFGHLVEALRQLAARGWRERAEVVVFGDIEPTKAPDLGLRTHYVGEVFDDSKLAALYSSADVMVVPSLQEAFGKTLIEGMACGTPIVAFDHGGPADIVEHGRTGYLARPFCTSDLADGIAWCLSDGRLTQELGERAQCRARDDYRIEVVAEQYRSLYQRILEA